MLLILLLVGLNHERAFAMPKGFEGCKGVPLVDSSASSVFAWLKNQGNGNKTMTDIVCCMPQKYRDDYLVAHSSISAQTSHYKSPRLIFGNLRDDGICFSIATNADPSLPQSNNIEILVKQGSISNEQLALYDLEVKPGERKLSERDPKDCLNCHGHVHADSSGPRPIFDKFPWPRLMSFQNDACVRRVEFMKKASEVATAAINNSPRFKCLRPPGGSTSRPDENHGIPFGRHDPLRAESSFRAENEKRVARELVQDPEFAKVQPFLIGLSKGCLVSGALFGSDGTIRDMPQSWFAPRGNPAQLLNMDSSLAKLTAASELYALVEARFSRYDQKVAAQEAKFKAMTEMLEKGQLPQFGADFGFLRCVSQESAQTELRQFKPEAERLPLDVQKYLYDDILKSADNGELLIKGEMRLRETFMRWALESRGMDTLGWDMHVQPNYHFDITGAIKNLPLAEKYKDAPDGSNLNGPTVDQEKLKRFSEMCRDLKAQSLEAQNATKTTPSPTDRATIQR